MSLLFEELKQKYPSEFVSLPTFAKILGNSPKTVNYWLRAGKMPIPYVKVGDTARVKLTEICEYIEKHTVHPKKPVGRPRKVRNVTSSATEVQNV